MVETPEERDKRINREHEKFLEELFAESDRKEALVKQGEKERLEQDLAESRRAAAEIEKMSDAERRQAREKLRRDLELDAQGRREDAVQAAEEVARRAEEAKAYEARCRERRNPNVQYSFDCWDRGMEPPDHWQNDRYKFSSLKSYDIR